MNDRIAWSKFVLSGHRFFGRFVLTGTFLHTYTYIYTYTTIICVVIVVVSFVDVVDV